MQALQRMNIVVKKSKVHGYGVFANEDIPKGSIIEECYTLKPLTQEKKQHGLSNFIFGYDDNVTLLPLGCGAIYNHSEIYNADYTYSIERDVMVFKATRFIKCGEEIFVTYGENWFSIRHMKARLPSFSYRVKKSLLELQILFRFTIVVASLLGIIFLLQKI